MTPILAIAFVGACYAVGCGIVRVLKAREKRRLEQIAKGHAEVRALPVCPCGRGIQLDEGLCCSCIEWNVERLRSRPVSKRYDPAGMFPEFLKPKPKAQTTRAMSSTALGRTLLAVGIQEPIPRPPNPASLQLVRAAKTEGVAGLPSAMQILRDRERELVMKCDCAKLGRTCDHCRRAILG
jgi:hypothetical protein